MREKRATAEKKRVSLYPFGLKHKGYNNVVNGAENNYKNFQGQELTEDLGLNVLEFKWRIHDPAIARFWQIDPLAEKFAYNSTYAFSENSPIGFFELEGLEKISIHSASFAPFKTFGGPFKGDGANRGFTTNPKASSRISGQVNINATSTGIQQGSATANGSDSHNTLTGNSTSSEAEIIANLSDKNPTNSDNITSAKLDFHISGNNDLVPGSPDIDTKGSIGIARKDLGEKGSIIGLSGSIFGDKFPSNETFLTDQSGTGVFLGVSGADGNPFTSLAGNNNRSMSSFTLAISFNKAGNISGVIYNGKSFSVTDWNKQFKDLKPASGNVSTNKN
ncbi:RHS repeat domain-containing protein [Tenacibaculum maritimum]|uniref:RHS repeat domain-containing protein n=1 Tax=Tenacibaculum maritimum TaxID=107401 RepID=UPI0038767D42